MKNYGNTIEEVIEAIFKEGLNDNESKVLRNGRSNQECFGYYVELERKSKEEIKKLKPIQKLFYTCKKLGNKRLLGENNSSDSENTFAQMLEFMFISLKDIFNGKRNESLDDDLKIYNVDDINRILNDYDLSHKLCGYIYREIDNRFRTYSINGGNPDFYYYQNKYNAVDYLYLDEENENGVNNYNQIELEKFESKTGELTKYILTTYWDCLTNAQQVWCNSIIKFGLQPDGSVVDLDNHKVLYTKQSTYKYKKNIRKRLEEKIKKDVLINDNKKYWTII